MVNPASFPRIIEGGLLRLVQKACGNMLIYEIYVDNILFGTCQVTFEKTPDKGTKCIGEPVIEEYRCAIENKNKYWAIFPSVKELLKSKL